LSTDQYRSRKPACSVVVPVGTSSGATNGVSNGIMAQTPQA
jgi:hypothetical protein